MGPQTRMFRILVALALSMISGAWVLSNTGSKPRETVSSPALLLSAQGQRPQPRSAALESGFDHIVVRCVVSSGYNLLSDKELEPGKMTHVTINERGVIHVQPAWRRLERLPGVKSAMVVRVEVPPSSSDLVPLQYEALEELLNHLCKQLVPPPRHVLCVSDHPKVTDLATSVSRVFRVLPVHPAVG